MFRDKCSRQTVQRPRKQIVFIVQETAKSRVRLIRNKEDPERTMAVH